MIPRNRQDIYDHIDEELGWIKHYVDCTKEKNSKHSHHVFVEIIKEHLFELAKYSDHLHLSGSNTK